MPSIQLTYQIKAPIQRVFDLSRSIDFHKISTAQTKEKAIAGVTSGLIKLGETVTWRAKHKGIWMNLQSTISEMNEYSFFVDEQVKGPFKQYRHEHYFEEKDGLVIMKDVFDFESPLGVLGRMANKIIAYRYLEDLLIRRNDMIKVCGGRALAGGVGSIVVLVPSMGSHAITIFYTLNSEVK